MNPLLCHVSSLSFHSSVMLAYYLFIPLLWQLIIIPFHIMSLSCQLIIIPCLCHLSSMCMELVQDPISLHVSVMSALCVWNLFRIPCHTIYMSCQLHVCGTCSGFHVTPYICHVSSMCVELVQDPISVHISVMSALCVWNLFRNPYQSLSFSFYILWFFSH